MPSKLHTAIQNVANRKKPVSGGGASYGKGWNAAMAEVQKVLDTFRDDGNGESRVRYEWGIQRKNGNIHRISVARGIVERELAEQIAAEGHPEKPASKLVYREVVAQLHGDWKEATTEAGVPD